MADSESRAVTIASVASGLKIIIRHIKKMAVKQFTKDFWALLVLTGVLLTAFIYRILN